MARVRRKFSEEFKQEAVRRMAERRAQGVSVQQIGRDLDVRPEMLRVWARQLAAHDGAPLADVFPGQGRLPNSKLEWPPTFPGVAVSLEYARLFC